MALVLHIGNKNYSSWSLRPWLALSVAGVAFEEHRIVLDQPQTKAAIRAVSPSGRVPCLHDDGLVIWDSLAICEHVDEQYAGGRLWPRDRALRALARSAACEMHSGFAAVRTHLPMDIRRRHPERGAAALARADVAAEVERLHALWTGCLAASGGPFLCGGFSIADAFFAPVITRFVTYGVAFPPEAQAWAERVLALPAMQAWTAAATAEPEVIAY